MSKIWRLSSKVVFKEVRANVFTVSFVNLGNKNRVEYERPWLFDNIFVLEQFDGLTPLKNMRFDKASQWLHLQQLPLMGGMHKIIGDKVGNLLGGIEDVKVEEDDVGWGKKLRVRVKTDLKKPLAKGQEITLM